MMYWRALLIVMFSPLLAIAIEDSASIQSVLDDGGLARGIQTIEAQLEASPQDDQLRFGLGVLQIVSGIERLAQKLHEYGARQLDHLPLKLPLRENADPAPINALRFGRMLDDFRRDLLEAERTLAGIRDDQVHLQISWANVQLDLDGDGQASDRFDEVLSRIFRFRPAILKENPLLRISFDRGDVAWLRAYCHLLAAIIDGSLSFLDEPRFDLWADQAFAKPVHPFVGTQEERWKKSIEVAGKNLMREPLRLRRMRRHLIQVTDLNMETWKYIRAETDDDHEWLPNPKQMGVLRLPVRDQMIDQWLAMMSELRLLLEGDRVLPSWLSGNDQKHPGKGLNLKLLLENPPQTFDSSERFPERYLTEEKEVNIGAFMILIQMFMDPGLVGYPVWFN